MELIFGFAYGYFFNLHLLWKKIVLSISVLADILFVSICFFFHIVGIERDVPGAQKEGNASAKVMGAEVKRNSKSEKGGEGNLDVARICPRH